MTARLLPPGRPPAVRAIDLGGRVPPHDADAEAAVLSAVLTHAAALDDVLEAQLAAEHFYGDANRRIFEAAVELHASGQPVDIQTVASKLRDCDRLKAVGGVAYISKLLDATPAVAHVAAHARIVRDKATATRHSARRRSMSERSVSDSVRRTPGAAFAIRARSASRSASSAGLSRTESRRSVDAVGVRVVMPGNVTRRTGLDKSRRKAHTV